MFTTKNLVGVALVLFLFAVAEILFQEQGLSGREAYWKIFILFAVGSSAGATARTLWRRYKTGKWHFD